MKKRVLAIAATAMATMMMASPVMAQDFKIGICNYVDDASLNQIVMCPMITVMQMPMLWNRSFLIFRLIM